MPSVALASLLQGLIEVETLLSADSTQPGRLPREPDIARVVGRGCVVLLTGHLEGYVSSVNQEVVDAVNAASPASARLPEPLRLRHSRSAVDGLFEVEWTKRAAHLAAFVHDEAWLWSPSATGSLVHKRLTEGVTSPLPEDLVRYYSLWGIGDIFTAITRTRHTRSKLWLGIRDLVEKRHRIAHGDTGAEATKQDVLIYMEVVKTFCLRADARLCRQLSRTLGLPPPW